MSATWVAKSITQLSSDDLETWKQLARQTSVPFSQYPSWGNAATQMGSEGFLVFSPEHSISALYLISGRRAECVNGPVLDWSSIETAQELNERISMAVFALYQTRPELEKITLKPRLDPGEYQTLKTHLSFPMGDCSEAETMQIPLESSADLQWTKLPARIRHEINRSRNHGVGVRTLEFSKHIESYWINQTRFYESRDLFIPPLDWILSVHDYHQKMGMHAEIISCLHPSSGSVSEILVFHCIGLSLYLFGHEVRNDSAPNISLNTCAQWQAIQNAIKNGSQHYDLNGLKIHIENSMPDLYSGVDFYKRKFKGEIVHYYSPVLRFGI